MDSSPCAVIDESVVYRKSGRGAAELAATHGGPLSPRERQLLILLDGRRTIAELSQLFGAEAVRSLTAELEAKGFAERSDPEPPPGGDGPVAPSDVGSAASERSKATPRWHRDWFALVNLGMLVLVMALAGALWAIGKRPSSVIVPFDATPKRTLPIDALSARGSGGITGASEADPAAAVASVPLSYRPGVRAFKPAAGTLPGPAVRQRLVEGRQGVGRTESRDAPR
jgi:hypothetical protein